MENFNIDEPIDLIKLAINEQIYIKCRQNRELKGKLIAYDSHLNMMLSDVEETFKKEFLDEQQEKII
jgi:U6 snRNA-associated Sm-like protein LSm3